MIDCLRKYPSLASLGISRSHATLDICIVTPDLLGPVNNGGIGTACSWLAFALAEDGHKIQILFAPQGVDNSDASWMESYERKGIAVEIIDQNQERKLNYFPDSPHLLTSILVYEWLAKHDHFDLVLFMDLHGNGFYCLHAKKSGLKFQNSIMVAIIHSPSIWHAMNNASIPDDPRLACLWHLERRSIEMADAIISPSSYMLNWCVQHGFKIGERVFCQPNILPSQDKYKTNIKLTEAVFFGRLEYRKGLEQFCSALDLLAKENRLPEKITFLGKSAWMGHEHSLSYIARRSKNWKNCQVNLIIDSNHREALAYLREGGRFAVIPSVADNSPYTVYECLAAGIPFLARDTGGVKELIAEKDRALILFGDNPRELAEKIANISGKTSAAACLAFDLNANKKEWLAGLPALVHTLRAKRQNEQKITELPFISVCVTHHNRPELLKQCIGSLCAQTYKNFEVILADDGSDNPDALAFLDSLADNFAKRSWRILRLPNGYAGRARNIAAKEAKGDWLLFLDDDNVAMPCMLGTFAKAAAQSAADLIVSSFYIFESMDLPAEDNIKERFLTAGDIISYSVIANSIGDTTSLMKAASFWQMGSFSEDYGIGHEDFELFLRFALAGKIINVIPEALFWYRKIENKDSVQLMTNADANYMRSMRPFMEMLPAPLAELAMLAHGMGRKLDCHASVSEDIEAEITAPEIDNSLNPQSDRALVQVAAYLEADGRNDLAAQIGVKIKQSSPESFQSLNLMASAREAAIEGDAQILEERLNLCVANGKKDPFLRGKNLSAFYVSLLNYLAEEKEPYSCGKLLIDKLKPCVIANIRMALAISYHCMAIKDIQNCLLYFFKALALAEDEYKTARKDVSHAIDDGIFFCGLQHYAFYGVNEQSKWPHRQIFKKILVTSQNIVRAICLTHMKLFKYGNEKLAEAIFAALKN